MGVGFLSVYGGLSLCRSTGTPSVYIIWRGIGNPTKIWISCFHQVLPSSNTLGKWSRTPCRSSPISPRAWPSVAFVLLDFLDYGCSRAVITPSGVLVNVFRSLAAVGVQSCQNFLWHGWDISALALFIHAAETGAVADQHVC